MAQTEVMSLRINSNLRHQGDSLLTRLGISPSSFISMAYSQLVMRKAVPFTLEVTDTEPQAFDSLSLDQKQRVVQEGYDDYVAGRTRNASDIHAEARAKYGF